MNWSLIGSNLLDLFLLTAVMVGIMYGIRHSVAKKSERSRYVGWYVFCFASVNFFVWGILELNTLPGMYRNLASMFGMLFGLVVGNIAGAFMWHFYGSRRGKDDSDE